MNRNLILAPVPQGSEAFAIAEDEIELSKRLACQTIVSGSVSVSWELKNNNK